MRRHHQSGTWHTPTITCVGLLAALAASVTLGPPALALGEFHELATLTASDAATGDYFGCRVAIDGDTAVVGAYSKDDTGAVYVFERSAGVWTQSAKLTASDAAINDGFGYAVAIAGSTIVVGSIYSDPQDVTDAGAVYIFDRSGGVWTETAKLVAAAPVEGDFFGGSVAITGSTVFVGAMYADHYSGRMDTGAAYVFDRSAGVWHQTEELYAADPSDDDHFGISVAVDANMAIIGAADDDFLDKLDVGSAYLFARSGAYWTQTAKLTASDQADSDFFGAAVAISGNTAVVGAFGNAGGGLDDAGAAYVYVLTSGVWTQTAKLLASDAVAYDQFGISVALAGDTAVIGADFRDPVSGGFTDVGAAYIFVRSSGVWRQTAKLAPSDPVDFALFGIAVALSGDTVLSAASNSGSSGVPGAGAVYVYDARRCAGDVNCDGVVSFADINPFVLALSGQSGYETHYPACRWMNADCNYDGIVSYADINPFVQLLSGS